MLPEASSSSSLPSGGQAKREEAREAPGAVSREASSPPAQLRSSERGWKCLWSLVWCARARSCLLCSFGSLGGGGAAHSQQTPLPALLPRWPLPAHHCTLCDVVSRESLQGSAPVRNPLMFPDLRIKEQGRIVEPALGRAAPLAGLSDLALAPLPARGPAVESVVAGTRLGRCPRGVTGHGLLTTISRVAFALSRGLREISRSPRIATDLAGIALNMTGHDLLIATGLGGSIRDPLLVGGGRRDRVIPLAALVTARGHGCGRLFPLTICGRRIEASEPDVSNGRVWRL